MNLIRRYALKIYLSGICKSVNLSCKSVCRTGIFALFTGWFYLSERFAQFDKHFGFAVFVEFVVAPCFVVGNGQARGDAFEMEGTVPYAQGGGGFFVAAVLFVAEEAGGLVTALGGAEA